MAKKHAPKGRIKARDRMDGADHMEAPRCTATSKQSGQRCKRRPIPGGAVCVMHGGGAPQVQAKAEERLRALVHPAITRLEELMLQKEYPSTAISAVKDVLDRNMGKAVEQLDVTVTGELDIVSRRLEAARKRLAEHA
jgi:hypothetical protein